jgi:hypothetical protein
MPGSIIGDSKNLSHTGKILCGASFFLGLIGILNISIQLPYILDRCHTYQENKKVREVVSSKSEEMSFVVIPFSKPKNAEEADNKAQALVDKLQALENKSRITCRTANDVLANAVLTGRIHPIDAENLQKEVEYFKIEKNNADNWVINSKYTTTDPKNQKTNLEGSK